MSIEWKNLPIINPNDQMLFQGNASINNAITTLGNAFKQVGTDFRDKNTNSALMDIARTTDVNLLPELRNNLMSKIDAEGSGIDGQKILAALDSQETSLQNKSMNQIVYANRLDEEEDRKLVGSNLQNWQKDPTGINLSAFKNPATGLALYKDLVTLQNTQEDRERTKKLRPIEDANNLAVMGAENRNRALATLKANNPGLFTSQYDPATNTYSVPLEGEKLEQAIAEQASSMGLSLNPVASYGGGKAASTSGYRVNNPPNKDIGKIVQNNLNGLSKALRSNPEIAKYANNDPAVLAMIAIESSGQINARSSAGAQGLMQVIPDTAKQIAKRLGIKGNLNTPENNIRIGAAYLNDMLELYDGDIEKAAAAYNAGPGTVDSAVKRANGKSNWLDFLGTSEKNKQETRNHVAKFVTALEAIQSGPQSLNTPVAASQNNSAFVPLRNAAEAATSAKVTATGRPKSNAPVLVDNPYNDDTAPAAKTASSAATAKSTKDFASTLPPIGKIPAAAVQEGKAMYKAKADAFKATRVKSRGVLEKEKLDYETYKGSIGYREDGNWFGDKGTFGNDSADVLRLLENNKMFNALPFEKKKEIHQTLVAENDNRQGLFGKNPTDFISKKVNKLISIANQSSIESEDAADRKSLLEAASVIRAKSGKTNIPVQSFLPLLTDKATINRLFAPVTNPDDAKLVKVSQIKKKIEQERKKQTEYEKRALDLKLVKLDTAQQILRDKLNR